MNLSEAVRHVYNWQQGERNFYTYLIKAYMNGTADERLIFKRNCPEIAHAVELWAICGDEETFYRQHKIKEDHYGFINSVGKKN